MTTASKKNKGRRLQRLVAEQLLKHVYLPAGLEPDDCKSVSMGVAGCDLLMSPAARKILDLAVECKNRESLNHTAEFWKHHSKHSHSTPILVSKRNRTEPLVTLRLEDFLDLITGDRLRYGHGRYEPSPPAPPLDAGDGFDLSDIPRPKF